MPVPHAVSPCGELLPRRTLHSFTPSCARPAGRAPNGGTMAPTDQNGRPRTSTGGSPTAPRSGAGGCGFVTKDKCADELMSAVRAASANEAVIPPSMLAQLLPRLRRAQRHTGSAELTPRETEILDLLAQGWSTDSIAQELVVSR